MYNINIMRKGENYMAINLNNFVDIKITKHISSTTVAERDTAVLIWFYDKNKETLNSLNVKLSGISYISVNILI